MKNVRRNTVDSIGGIRALAILLLLIVFVAGCDARSEASQQIKSPPEVDVARVQAESVTVTETFTGRVKAPETVELRPRVRGYIHEVAFEEGEKVEAGDLMFRIDPRPYQARLKAARAEFARARSQLALAGSEAKRAERLLKKRAISQEEYDQRRAAQHGARARVEAAQAALETAELNLQYTRVTAPVSGRTGRALVTQGNLASADQTSLATVVSVDPLHVYFESNDASAGRTLPLEEQAAEVRVGLADEEGFPHRGEVDFIDNRLNPSTGTLQYRAVVPNPHGKLRPGQFARVRMPVARLEQALLVDRKAVLTDQDRRYVYVVNGENKTARRQVVTGRGVGKSVVIRDGLKSGDRVVVNGTQKIFRAGMEVTPRRVAMHEERMVPDSATASRQP